MATRTARKHQDEAGWWQIDFGSKYAELKAGDDTLVPATAKQTLVRLQGSSRTDVTSQFTDTDNPPELDADDGAKGVLNVFLKGRASDGQPAGKYEWTVECEGQGGNVYVMEFELVVSAWANT